MLRVGLQLLTKSGVQATSIVIIVKILNIDKRTANNMGQCNERTCVNLANHEAAHDTKPVKPYTVLKLVFCSSSSIRRANVVVVEAHCSSQMAEKI